MTEWLMAAVALALAAWTAFTTVRQERMTRRVRVEQAEALVELDFRRPRYRVVTPVGTQGHDCASASLAFAQHSAWEARDMGVHARVLDARTGEDVTYADSSDEVQP